MVARARTLFTFVAMIGSSACTADRPTGVTAVPQTLHTFSAKAPSVEDSKARYTFYLTMPDGSTPTQIVGDGRLVDGTSAGPGEPSVYEGGMCGVTSRIFWWDARASQSGDAVFGPAGERSVCGGVARALSITGFGLISPPMNFRAIMQLEVDSSRVHQLNIGVGSGGCARIQYRDDVQSTVKVTRLSDNPITGRRMWRAESGGTHLAACDVVAKGAYQFTGRTYYLPMHVLIEEVR